MYLAQAFTILLFLSVSTQKVLKPEVFDDISNMTKKCQDAIKTHTEQVQACNIKLAQKWEDKLINDVNNTKTFEKDICDVIKDEENQCINIVKVNNFNSIALIKLVA